MKAFTFEIGGFSASARTLKKARELVDRDITKATEGSFEPLFIDFKKCRVVIWREPCLGWTYRTIDGVSRELSLTPMVLSAKDEDREVVERRARLHVAQMLYHPGGEGFQRVTGEEAITNDVDRREHLAWVEWQDRAALARLRGVPDEDIHAVASGLKPMPAADPVLVPPPART